MSNEQSFSTLLRQYGFRATPGRIDLLQALKTAGKPLSIAAVAKKLKKKMDYASVYRALEALTDSGLVRRMSLGHAHTHYELTAGITHHHHIVCESCSHIEDIEDCDTTRIEKKTLKQSRDFSSIEFHSLEFFGLCKKCAKNKK